MQHNDKNKIVSCFDKKCILITNPNEIYLVPNKIKSIIIPDFLNIPKDHILVIKSHLCQMMFRIIETFINPMTNNSISLIAKSSCLIPTGAVIGHYQLVPINSLFGILEGINYF
jgi:hypothetical protein